MLILLEISNILMLNRHSNYIFYIQICISHSSGGNIQGLASEGKILFRYDLSRFADYNVIIPVSGHELFKNVNAAPNAAGIKS